MDGGAGTYLAVVAAGVAAGAINTVAGGGSMLTLPALMALGLPADVANGTNRLSVVSQSISGILGFRRAGALDEAAVAPVLLPTAAGAFAGAVLASRVPPGVLKPVLLATMVAVAALWLARPAAVTAPARARPRRLRDSPAGVAGLLAAGVYGGFVQAGVGFVLLSVLGGALRYGLAAANALKLVCTLVFGVVALAVFARAGQVAWGPAAVLAASTVVGSQLGVRFAVRAPPAAVRWIVFCAVVATCAGAYVRR
ncbi:MAG: sulfite exporter TauE/SafE family protein [Deltaproteobacteria bacterium]|nr:MAG: sulfite exporter TauE/SafE family protein [Deltaproteobacteria bacterium]